MKACIIGSILLLQTSLSYSQFKAWHQFYSPADSSFSAAVTGNSNYAFVTGKVKSSITGWDIHTLRYNIFAGTQATPWIFAGASDEEPVNMVAGGNNHLYISAKKKNSFNNYDLLLLKYSTTGSLIWQKEYSGAANGDEIPYSMVYNNSDNKIYITASSYTGPLTNKDILTVKIDTSGNILWTKFYNYSSTGNSIDVPSEIIYDEAFRIYVSGTSDNTNNVSSIVTLAYDTSGTLMFARRWGDSLTGESISAGLDTRPGIALAAGGYFFNGSDYDYIALNYNLNGVLRWSKTFDGSSNDFLSDIKIDNALNVIVTGSSFVNSVNNYDYATVKYLPEGDSGWVNFLNGSGSGKDSAVALLVDGFNCVFVTGKSTFTNGRYAFGSVLYNTAGFFHWISYYRNSITPGDNIPVSISKYLFTNSFLITGSTFGNPQNTYTTIFYGGIIDEVTKLDDIIPFSFKLYQNYPNPFNPSTSIRFHIPPFRTLAGKVKLSVINLLGKEEILINEVLYPGSYEYNWDSKNSAAGIYFYTLSYGGLKETKKMILIK